MLIKKPNALPVIFLAFANDQTSDKRYLRNLPKELKNIRTVLTNAEKEGLCELKELANASIEEIYDVFQDQRYRDRIAIFHFGGHANSYELLLEADDRTKSPAYTTGFIPFLARQKGLELVFLNGCSTQAQATKLIHAGVDAVIGTAKAVQDEVACSLSTRFYNGLGEGLTIHHAWEDAKSDLITTKGGVLRDTYLRKNVADENELPWKLIIRHGAATTKSWSLPIAANNPFFGLPKMPIKKLPEQPFRFLERYKKEDAPIFFGRGRYIRKLYFRLTRKDSSPVILLTGQSGVGKSSLLEAGLFPRMQEEHAIFYIRRKQHLGILGSLVATLSEEQNTPTPFDLLFYWHQLETKIAKPVSIILDQIEEVFTRPNKDLATELNDFLQIVQTVFIDVDKSPRGKLILSYRKEYHTDISGALSKYKIPQESLNIERLTKQEVKAIVNGLTTKEDLKNKYQLTIEEGLPQIIADNLWKDKDTPVAPVLQIILTKLWQQQTALNQENGTFEKKFTVDNYNQLLDKGILLDDFFHQQMNKILYWENALGKTAYNSGLALDILHFHTTAFNTAESRTLEDLRDKYQHQADILEKLIVQFKDRYLLTTTKDNKKIALAHDLLAPVIHKANRDSDKPGQRAKRILEAKVVEYELNKDTTLDEADLALVEKGANGMRLWTNKEKEIVEKSRLQRKQLIAERNTTKKAKILGVVSLFLFALTAGLFWRSAHKQAKVNRLVSEALQQEKEDATLALVTINEALQIMPDHDGAIQARHDIYSYNEFYKDTFKNNSPVVDIAYASNKKLIVNTDSNNVIIRTVAGKYITTISHPATVKTLTFSPDENQILTGCQDGNAYLWTIDGRPIQTYAATHQGVNTLAFSSDGTKVLIGHQNGTVNLWDNAGNILHSFAAHTNEVSSVAFSPSGDTLLTGGKDGQVFLWDNKGNVLTNKTLAAKVHSVAYAPDGRGFLVGSRDGIARYYSITDACPLKQTFQGHSRRINKVLFSPNGQFLFTASDDKTIKYWKLDGTLLKTYKGHTGFVHSLALSKDGVHFLSASEDQTLKYWKKESKIRRSFTHPGPIGAMDISTDGQYILTGVADKTVSLSRNINDIGLKDTTFFDAFDNPEGQPAYLWDTLGNQIQNFEGHQGGITSVAIAPNARSFLTGSTDYTAQLWNLEGISLTTFPHTNQIMDVAFSQDGQQVLTASMDSTLGIWAIDGPKIDALVHPDKVSSVAATKDFIVTGCYDDTIRLFTPTGNLIKAFSGGMGDIESITVSSDQQYIVAGNGGKVAQVAVWTIDGALLWKKAINEGNKTGAAKVGAVDFSEDGALVVAAVEGYGGKVWDLVGREVFSLNNKYLLVDFFKSDDMFLVNKNSAMSGRPQGP